MLFPWLCTAKQTCLDCKAHTFMPVPHQTAVLPAVYVTQHLVPCTYTVLSILVSKVLSMLDRLLWLAELHVHLHCNWCFKHSQRHSGAVHAMQACLGCRTPNSPRTIQVLAQRISQSCACYAGLCSLWGSSSKSFVFCDTQQPQCCACYAGLSGLQSYKTRLMGLQQKVAACAVTAM